VFGVSTHSRRRRIWRVVVNLFLLHGSSPSRLVFFARLSPGHLNQKRSQSQICITVLVTRRSNARVLVCFHLGVVAVGCSRVCFRAIVTSSTSCLACSVFSPRWRSPLSVYLQTRAVDGQSETGIVSPSVTHRWSSRFSVLIGFLVYVSL